jgi:CBS domain-containing protein
MPATMAKAHVHTSPIPEAMHVPVSMLMNRELVTVRPDVSVETAVETMLDQGLSRMPVVDEQGALQGIFSKTDVIADAHMRGDTEEEAAPLSSVPGVSDRASGLHVHATGPSVGDVMSRAPVTVCETETVARAAELMSVYQLHALPVLSPSGALVGILSSHDVLEWVAGVA